MKDFNHKTPISIKEILYEILKIKKLLKKYKITKTKFFKDSLNPEKLKKQIYSIENHDYIVNQTQMEEYFELTTYTKNLTKLAKDKKLDTVIGREKEIQTLINILSRRNKNNAILIGDPGVGKTAIIEGLAIKIIGKEINTNLKNKIILLLNISTLIAGTKYRGEFEERINNILKVLTLKQNIIIFIDEIHTLIGAGNSEGSLDASNILKPVLSRSEIQLIGATTYEEYKKHIEQDKAFARRFQIININEPNDEETFKILEGVINNYEDYHKVKYTKESIQAVISLSSRYLPNKSLPDKAIDLIDIAGAKKKLLKTENKEINEKDIRDVINEILGIKTKNNLNEELSEIKRQEEEINKIVIGQEEAIKNTIQEVIRFKLELNTYENPLTSLLFIGTNGIGKTTLANELAKRILGNKNPTITLDMSEYKEEHSLSKIIGTTPGYVGYLEGSILFNKLKYLSNSLILLENIENAHSSILNLFMNILENGEIKDNKNNKISFKNSIIIMTTNIGSKALLGEREIGFNQTTKDKNKINLIVEQELKKRFKLEFLNRIQKKIIFNVLNKETVGIIYRKYLQELLDKFDSKNIKIKIDIKIEDHIIKNFYNKNSGIRGIKVAIKEQIEDRIINKLITNNGNLCNEIKIFLSDDLNLEVQ